MRISDWSSDVCSSDLQSGNDLPGARFGAEQRHRHHPRDDADDPDHQRDQQEKEEYAPAIVVGQPPAGADGVDRISDAAITRRRNSHRESDDAIEARNAYEQPAEREREAGTQFDPDQRRNRTNRQSEHYTNATH